MDILPHCRVRFNGATSITRDFSKNSTQKNSNNPKKFDLGSQTKSEYFDLSPNITPDQTIFEHLENKPYLTLCTPLLLNIFQSETLSDTEKLHYIAYYALSRFNPHQNFVKKSGLGFSKILDCSEQWVFKTQKFLEQKNYLRIDRTKDERSHNNINQIIPILPETEFLKILSTAENQFKAQIDSSVQTISETDRVKTLNNQKLFIRINFELLELILGHQQLSTFDKLLWLYCYLKDYAVYLSGQHKNLLLSVRKLAKLFNKHEVSIRRTLNRLEFYQVIQKERLKIHNGDESSNRKKKPLFRIKINLSNYFQDSLDRLENRCSKKLSTKPKKKLIQSTMSPKVITLIKAPLTQNEAARTNSKAGDTPTSLLINKNNNQIILNKNFSLEADLAPEPEQTEYFKSIPDSKVLLETAFQNFESSKLKQEFQFYFKTPHFPMRLVKNIIHSRLTPDKIGISKSELTLAAIYIYKQIKKYNNPPDPNAIEFQLLQEITNPTQRLWLNEETIYHFLPEIEPQESEFKRLERECQSTHPGLPMTVDPEKLVSPDIYNRIVSWIDRLADRREIRGEAQFYSKEQLIEQIAYHVRTWVSDRPCYHADHFKIYVACKMLRNASWRIPHGLVKSREMGLKMEKIGYQRGYL